MSTPVDNSLTGLKASTAQIMAIISRAQQIPPGNSYFSLTTQISSLVAQVIKDYGSGPLPGIVLSCSKELLCVWGMTPQVWPNWHNIGYNNPRLLTHVWRPKLLTWEALGDHTFDLPVAAPPSTGPIPVDLPSPPIRTGNVAGPSTSTTTEFQDKGKGKAVDADLEPKAEGSWKRKSPMISGLSSQPPKSVMKTCKHAKSSCWVASKPLVDLEDEEDMGIQPLSGGVPEVILPQLSNSPRSPWVLTKKPFGPATVIAGSHPAVIEPSQPTPESPVEAPPVIDGGDILIPRPNNPCQACTKLNWDCATWLDKRTGNPCMSCIHCTTKKIKCILATMGTLPKCVHGSSTTWNTRSRTPSKAPSKAPPTSQSKAQTRSQSHGKSRTLGVTAVTTPKTQMHGRSKTITAIKAPAPAPASPLSLSSAVPAPAPGPAVPAAALNLPMLDLHAMAIAIQDGAACITILKAHVAEQDGKIDTLQCLHEGLRREIIDRHPAFPLLEPPANATSLLLDQSAPPTMSPSASALPPLIDLSIGEMMPAPLKFENASAIEGLLFEYNWVVQPEVPDTSGENVDPCDPGNLVPEYDSSNDMDVEVKVEASFEEVDMAT
ncbi:uncharacterized protein BJ212DRAFT_1547435 [Suillus subaureus]|uniref:Zn(2)-C6 fungal-type domain-containing protein n=1 Tax=Suillus subaureus TaxID=48587 RepID=A0A9P7JH24_9AGAM|nr:uncharacterized protein BJ212DRAFT_1547435 [Suillus subaureus]KAG1821859.1 hypothetical protein BJ212DRAFT_1547435 [Suillus subaureus]